MQTDAGADGTAAAVWSDGTTVRAAVKPAGGSTFGQPVPIGSGQAPDVAVGPGGRVLAVWAANDGLHAAERPAGAPGFGDLGVILAKAGTSDPQVAFFADGRAAAKATYTGGFAGVVRQSGADSFVPTEFGLATTINGSDMTVSDQTGEVVIALAIKTGSTSQVLLARVSSNGMATANAFDPQTDTSSMFNSTSYFHLAPRVVADDRIVVTYITEKNVSSIVPTSQTTTLRSLVRPAVGPPQLGDVDVASNGGFFGPYLNNPSLTRRSDGTVTAAWVDTDLGVASLRLSTADLPLAATTFNARDDVEGFGGALGAIVGATEMARLPNAAAGLVASDGTAVRAATSAGGQPFGAPIDLVSGADTPSSARLAGDGLGGLLATWTQADGANRRAFARLYDDAPPTLSNVATPAALNAGQAGPFSATATDTWTGATPVWDFGDGQTATGAQVSHSYASGGSFTVSVVARDAAGNVSGKVERAVSVTGPAGGGPGPSGTAGRQDGAGDQRPFAGPQDVRGRRGQAEGGRETRHGRALPPVREGSGDDDRHARDPRLPQRRPLRGQEARGQEGCALHDPASHRKREGERQDRGEQHRVQGPHFPPPTRPWLLPPRRNSRRRGR